MFEFPNGYPTWFHFLEITIQCQKLLVEQIFGQLLLNRIYPRYLKVERKGSFQCVVNYFNLSNCTFFFLQIKMNERFNG